MKDWQTISLDFLKEIILEYYSDSENYKNKVIEIKTSDSNPDRMFLDRVTPEKQGKSDFIKNCVNIIEKQELVDPMESSVLSMLFEKNFLGAMVLLRKEDDCGFITFGRRLLKDMMEELTEGEKESLKNEISELKGFLDTYTPDRYFPIDKLNLENFLWEGLIVSTPPSKKDDANDKLKFVFSPVWFKKNTDTMQEQDWDLSLSERFAKIRSYEYEEFKEIIDKQRGMF